jgi:GNAT superfamily N-acetyltransferase
VRLRDPLPEDAPQIAEITRVALGYDVTAGDVARRMLSVLADPAQFLLVAEDEAGRAIGYIHACDYPSLFYEPLKYVIALAVEPTYHGYGTGRALLTACEEWAKKGGAAGVRLSSGANRVAAHSFYQHLGYVIRKDQKSLWKLF